MILTAAEFHNGWKQAVQQAIANLELREKTTRQQYEEALPIWGWLREEMNSTALAAQQEIVEHHWRTRFYQQLSPVIGLVDMVYMGWCHLPLPGWRDYPGLLMDATAQRQWLADWANQDLQRAGDCSVIGLQTACEWLREESASTDVYVDEFSVESFERMMTGKLRFLLLAPGVAQRHQTHILDSTWRVFDDAYRSFNMMMQYLFEQAEGHGHHAKVAKVLCRLRSTGRDCAAVRTTSVAICKVMSASCALLSLLHSIPDVPYRQEGERPGVRWHQPGAWHIIQAQLEAMAGRVYVATSPRAMCWRKKCRGLDSKPCKCKTVYGS
jgi:hypothetical protein